LEAVENLQRLVDEADKETRKRLFLGIGRKYGDDKESRYALGKDRWNKNLEGLKAGAEYAVKRAKKEKGQGRKAADPARLPLAIELTQIWLEFTGQQKPKIAKKGERARDAGFLRFVNRTLKLGAELNLEEKSLWSLMRDARDELIARSDESAESDKNDDFE
jgi:hypothetical protein